MTEIADIFSQYGKAYRKKHKLPLNILKAMSAIESCRTANLGGHIDECNECGHIRISYNSCRNRHCPKCQSLSKERWLEDRKKDLLPTQYFHIVFTIPDELNSLTLRNKKEIYTILFKASSETLLELTKDNKHLGANIGFISILHTWGQNLMDHPHIHSIVTGGGLSLDEKRWISSKKDFFIPVKAMSRLFRGKFLYYLKKLYYDSELKVDVAVNRLAENKEFQKLIDNLYEKEWVVYSKPPFKSPEYVLEYLGRYTHKVAISNNRIISLEEGRVTFKWRDYRDDNKNKFMTLDSSEFIRRFLLHILPNGFVKIRHYGILSNRNRVTKLNKCKELLEVFKKIKSSKDKESWQELILRLTGIDYTICPSCSKGNMSKREKITPRCYSPPGVTVSVA